MRSAGTFLLVLVLCSCAFLLFQSCEKKSGPGLVNRRPHVFVTGGPPQGGTASYSVTIYWTGVDSDGFIDHFLYAIDDTTVWNETRHCQGSFLFTADSLRQGEEFGRWHTFWIKAVDDDGAESIPFYLTFDARTIAPRTTIINPRCDPEGDIICEGPIAVGTSVTFVWEGEDPDCSNPSKEPVGYSWRLFNVTKYCICDFGIEDPALLDLPDYVPDSTSFWSDFTTDTEVRFQDLDPGAYWWFGVRAIDEAGAIEPHLRPNYNAVYLKTMPGCGAPLLRVFQGEWQHFYPKDGQVWERFLPLGAEVCFWWDADASSYGETICGYKYGIDIDDLDDPGQWETEWDLDVTSACVTFAEPGFHYLYIKAKDCAGNEQLGIVEMEVVEGVFDRDVLLVDDYLDYIPNDAAHDAFLAQVLDRCYQYTDSIYVFNTFPAGPGGEPRETRDVVEPTLSELMRYRLVIWVTDAVRNQFDTGLSRVVQDGVLQQYLRSGGRLWLFGREIVRGSADYPEMFQYPSEPDQDSFAAQWLKISGTVNRPIVGPLNLGDGFRGADPNKAVSQALPILDIDYAKGGTSENYGMSKIEAVMTAMQDPFLEQRPDTLFFYRANYSNSSYQGKACGFRSHDTYGGSKVVYLGFPLHYFYYTQAESLATFVIDWMFEDMPWSVTPASP